MEGTNEVRANRITALLNLKDEYAADRFDFHDPPWRFLSIETDEIGEAVELHQAETILEIVRLLERSETVGTDTEIHDLDSGEVLRPDFERSFRVPRIYGSDNLLYWSAE